MNSDDTSKTSYTPRRSSKRLERLLGPKAEEGREEVDRWAVQEVMRAASRELANLIADREYFKAAYLASAIRDCAKALD